MGATGLTVQPEVVQDQGAGVQQIANGSQQSAQSTLSGDGPLSAGLASAHTSAMQTATAFIQQTVAGLHTAGTTLSQFGQGVADGDRQNATAIRGQIRTA